LDNAPTGYSSYKCDSIKPRIENSMRQVDSRASLLGSEHEDNGEQCVTYGVQREWGSLFHNWGAACGKERFVILRHDRDEDEGGCPRMKIVWIKAAEWR